MKSVLLETHRVPRSGTMKEVARADPFSNVAQAQSDFARQLMQDMSKLAPVIRGKPVRTLEIENELLRKWIRRLVIKIKAQRTEIRCLHLDRAMAPKEDRKAKSDAAKWFAKITALHP